MCDGMHLFNFSHWTTNGVAALGHSATTDLVLSVRSVGVLLGLQGIRTILDTHVVWLTLVI